MVIRKTKHTAQYAVIPNDIFDASGLSAEACGVLGYFLTKPPKWRVDVTHVQRRFGIGSDKAYRIMGELQAAGYARRLSDRNAAGKYVRQDYLICDIPLPPKPVTDETVTDEPFSVKTPPRGSTDSSVNTDSRKHRGAAHGREDGKPKNDARAAAAAMRDELRKRMRTDEQE